MSKRRGRRYRGIVAGKCSFRWLATDPLCVSERTQLPSTAKACFLLPTRALTCGATRREGGGRTTVTQLRLHSHYFLKHCYLAGVQALVNTFVNELVPLFAATSFQAGGMALEASQLAGPLAFSGAAFLIYAGRLPGIALTSVCISVQSNLDNRYSIGSRKSYR